MSNPLNIASRTSPLAYWQSQAVQQCLLQINFNSNILPIESSGDLKLTQPIYSLGIVGVFTKELDMALLNKQADIAVHSLKDVPTNLAKGLCLVAVLPRAAHQDVVLYKQKNLLEEPNIANIATSSLRRMAQWQAKFSQHKMMPIRGNVQTRLKKFYEDESLNGIIFAKAGLERLALLPNNHSVLDWMIPAPAQGIIGIVCREDDKTIIEICLQINHEETLMLANIERQFMNTLQGGCSVPIAALAEKINNKISFVGAMHDFDGKAFFKIKQEIESYEAQFAGRSMALKLLEQNGAKDLLQKIKTYNNG